MRSALISSIAALAAAAVAIVLAVVALADSDSGGGSTGDLERQVDEVQSSLADIESGITTAQLIGALTALDSTGIHEFDEQTLQAASLEDVPSGYAADVRKVRHVSASVQWPSELEEEVMDILAQAEAIEAALDAGDDLAAIKAASPEFHQAWHNLRSAGYSHLSGEEPEGADHPAGEDDADMHDEMDSMDGAE